MFGAGAVKCRRGNDCHEQRSLSPQIPRNEASYAMQSHTGKHQSWSGAEGAWEAGGGAFIVTFTGGNRRSGVRRLSSFGLVGCIIPAHPGAQRLTLIVWYLALLS